MSISCRDVLSPSHRREAVHSKVGAALEGSQDQRVERPSQGCTQPADVAVPLSALRAPWAQMPGPTQAALGERVLAPEPFKGRSQLHSPSPRTP